MEHNYQIFSTSCTNFFDITSSSFGYNLIVACEIPRTLHGQNRPRNIKNTADLNYNIKDIKIMVQLPKIQVFIDRFRPVFHTCV